jgi:hypothetical protein
VVCAGMFGISFVWDEVKPTPKTKKDVFHEKKVIEKLI